MNLGEEVSKKNLDWGDLGFDYIKTDFRYSALYENGEWSAGSLISDAVSYTHLTLPTKA